MAIEHRNPKILLNLPHERGDIEIVRVHSVQVCLDGTENDFGTRYLVTQGKWQIPVATVERAEEIATEALKGLRVIGE